MLKFLVTFGIGVYVGVFACQNYNVPTVDPPAELYKKLVEKFNELSDEYRKK